MRRLRYALGLLVLVLLAVGIVFWVRFDAFTRTPLAVASNTAFIVPRGASVRGVVSRLVEAGHAEAHWGWRWLTRIQPVTIRAGEYRLTPGLTPPQVLELFASGDVIQYPLTIVEGWTWRDLKAALDRDPVLIPDRELVSGSPVSLLDPDNPHAYPEGWFLPETYLFVRGDTQRDLLARAYRAMQAELDAVWTARDDDLPLETPYELLILASIVEKESALEEERDDIAGVFVRRLQRGWRLETDPTVIYGLGESFDGDLRRRDLVADTPYNTYTRFGLPPTPIAMPSAGALRAASRPADGSAMFFVASGDGGHVFSDTLEEHNRAVRALLNRTP